MTYILDRVGRWKIMNIYEQLWTYYPLADFYQDLPEQSIHARISDISVVLFWSK